MKAFVASIRRLRGCDPNSGTFIFNLLHVGLFLFVGLSGLLALIYWVFWSKFN